MMKRQNEAQWVESENRWVIKVQKDGVRKGFVSAVKGRKGKHIAENKADAWLSKGTEDMHFDVAWDAFLADQKQRTGTANYKKHEGVGRLHITPVIGVRKVSTITPVMWQECINKAAVDGMSRRTCLNIRNSITAFTNYARRARWDVIQLVDGDLTIPNSAEPEKQKTILQPNDIRKLFSEDTIKKSKRIVKAHYIHAWRFLVATGLRRGELCGLKNEDITDDVVSIKRSINAFGEETHGKNDNARRTFVLNPTAKAVLNDQRKYLQEIGITSDWVFPDEYGERPDPKSLADRWRFYCKQHGYSCTVHELRHTFISLSKSDLPLELMKQVVGHSSSMDTYGIYGHTVEGDAQRAAKIVGNVFDGILKKKEEEE